MNIRVSDLVNLLYPKQNLSKSYEIAFNNSMMTLGSEIHRYIQRNLKRSDKYLSIEHSGVFHLQDFDVSFHIDAYNPFQRSIYEIKSSYQIDNNFDKVRTQAQIYAYLVNASKIYYLKYKIAYDIIEEEADYNFAKHQLKRALNLVKTRYFQQTTGNALDSTVFKLTNHELKEIFDKILQFRTKEEVDQYILDLYQKLI